MRRKFTYSIFHLTSVLEMNSSQYKLRYLGMHFIWNRPINSVLTSFCFSCSLDDHRWGFRGVTSSIFSDFGHLGVRDEVHLLLTSIVVARVFCFFVSVPQCSFLTGLREEGQWPCAIKWAALQRGILFLRNLFFHSGQ